jgi:hypothetical protein
MNMSQDLFSVGVNPTFEIRYIFDSATKDPIHDNTYITNRMMPEFKQHTYQMIRIADMIGQMQQKPAPSYEFIAKDEYERGGGSNYYPRLLALKLKDI